MTTATQMKAPTTPTAEIVRAVPSGGDGYTCYDVFDNVLARGERGTKLLARTLVALARERKKKGGESAAMNTQPSDHQSGVSGVTWDSIHKKWKIAIRQHGKTQSLGMLADLDQAIAMRREAENLTTAEFRQLKIKYGILVRPGVQLVSWPRRLRAAPGRWAPCSR